MRDAGSGWVWAERQESHAGWTQGQYAVRTHHHLHQAAHIFLHGFWNIGTHEQWWHTARNETAAREPLASHCKPMARFGTQVARQVGGKDDAFCLGFARDPRDALGTP